MEVAVATTDFPTGGISASNRYLTEIERFVAEILSDSPSSPYGFCQNFAIVITLLDFFPKK